MKKQTGIIGKQYQRLDKVYGYSKSVTNKKCGNSDLVYTNFSLTNSILLVKSLISFTPTQTGSTFKRYFNKINEPKELKSRTVDTRKGRILWKMQLLDYWISRWWNFMKNTLNYKVQKKMIFDLNATLTNYFLMIIIIIIFVPILKHNEKATIIPLLKGDEEEAKEGTWSEILTWNRLLTIHRVLLAKIKAGNNLYKLKNKAVIRQILYLLYQRNKISKPLYKSFTKLLQQSEWSLKTTGL